jgi:Domain of unknown function (DUF4403)
LIPSISKDEASNCSSIQVDIRITESWLANLVSRDGLIIPVGDHYQLHHLLFRLKKDSLTVMAEIVSKPGSFIEVNCNPRWDSTQQHLLLDDLQIQVRSKNLLVKSAAWFVTTFMQEKIDKRLEEYTHALYKNQLERVKAKLTEIPIPGNGTVKAQIESITIHEMKFEAEFAEVKATLEGKWEVLLNT